MAPNPPGPHPRFKQEMPSQPCRSPFLPGAAAFFHFIHKISLPFDHRRLWTTGQTLGKSVACPVHNCGDKRSKSCAKSRSWSSSPATQSTFPYIGQNHDTLRTEQPGQSDHFLYASITPRKCRIRSAFTPRSLRPTRDAERISTRLPPGASRTWITISSLNPNQNV